MKSVKKNLRKAQGMTEYIIIVAVVAILSIAVIMKFGNQIRDIFWASGTELSGNDADVTNVMGDQSEEQKSGIDDL
jgi:Flp pilus assembly pilin Flp